MTDQSPLSLQLALNQANNRIHQLESTLSRLQDSTERQASQSEARIAQLEKDRAYLLSIEDEMLADLEQTKQSLRQCRQDSRQQTMQMAAQIEDLQQQLLHHQQQLKATKLKEQSLINRLKVYEETEKVNGMIEQKSPESLKSHESHELRNSLVSYPAIISSPAVSSPAISPALDDSERSLYSRLLNEHSTCLDRLARLSSLEQQLSSAQAELTSTKAQLSDALNQQQHQQQVNTASDHSYIALVRENTDLKNQLTCLKEHLKKDLELEDLDDLSE